MYGIEARAIERLYAAIEDFETIGDYSSAIKCCDIVLGKDPKSILALASKGNALSRRGEKYEAKKYFDKVNRMIDEILIKKKSSE